MPTMTLRARVTGAAWWYWSALGALASVGVGLAGSAVGAVPRPASYRWWFHVSLGGYGAAHVVLYISLAVLGVAWLALGVSARRGELSVTRALATFVAWASPLFVAPPLFSRDIYSYIAQGKLARAGLNPYKFAPDALAHNALFYSLAHVWTATPSPYGPLFVILARASAAISGPSLIAQVLVFRSLELIGVALALWALTDLSRRLGAHSGVALWLGVLSPLALLSDVASAHNDTLMIGLLLVGLVLAQRGARRGAVAVIAIAAAVKLPALAGVVVLVVRDARALPWRRALAVIGEALAITALVLAACTLVNGFGWGWASYQALSIPSELRTLASPSVSLGAFIAASLRVAGAHTLATHGVVTVVQHLCDAASAAGVVFALSRVHAHNAYRILGLILLAVVVGGPTLWPWYLLWGISVLAVTSAQRWRPLALTALLATLVVGPGGSPMLGGVAYLITAPALVLGAYWFVREVRREGLLEGADRVG